jgi:MYXO-CTERM domain-containing protein
MKHTIKHPIDRWKLTALLVGLATGVQAQTISWNFDRNGTLPTDASSYAGVVSANYWNNSWPADPTVDLLANSGLPSTLDLSYGPTAYAWSIQGSHPGQDANGSFNRELLNGYLNAGYAGWNPPVTASFISLSQIPYSQYDIYVYFSSDVADRPGFITDGTTTFYFNSIGPASVSGANALFAQTTETSNANHPQANYAVFSGLNGGSQNITLQMEVPDLWGGIAGFQVVAVPEPTSWAIGLLGFAALGMRRRKRRL